MHIIRDIFSMKRMLQSKIVRGFVSTLAGSGTSKAILMLATFLFSNIMSKNDFGEFSFVRNTLNTILCMCALNFTSLCTKFTVEANEDFKAIYRLIIVFLFSVVVCVATGLVLEILPDGILLRVFPTLPILHSFKIIGVLLPLFILQPLIEGVFRGLKKFKLIGLLQVLSSVFFVCVVYVGVSFAGIIGALYGIIAYYSLYSIISVIVLVRLKLIDMSCLRCKELRKEHFVLSKMILPVFFMSFVEAPILWIAQVLLSKYDSMSAVGSMSAIMQVKNLVILIPAYFVSTFLPFAGELNAQGRFAEYFDKYRRMMCLFLLIGSLLFLLISIFSSPILGLYGKEYKADSLSLVISSIGIPVFMLINLLRTELIIREHQKLLLFISMIWNAIWLVVLYLLLNLGMNALQAFFVSQLIGWVVNLIGYYIVYLNDRAILIKQ